MTSSEVEYDESVLGVEVELGQFEVTKEQILAFCGAIGDTNPLYTDAEAANAGPHGGLIAPPSFYVTGTRGGRGLDPKVTFGNTSFNAAQHCEFHEPMRPGDVIDVTGSVHEIYEKTGRSGRMLFVVRRTTLRNQNDQLVAVVDNSTVHRQVERE